MTTEKEVYALRHRSTDGWVAVDLMTEDKAEETNEKDHVKENGYVWRKMIQAEPIRHQSDELQEILDLLRTGTAPMSWGMTEAQWSEHKCNKAAGKLAAVIARLEANLGDTE